MILFLFKITALNGTVEQPELTSFARVVALSLHGMEKHHLISDVIAQQKQFATSRMFKYSRRDRCLAIS